MALQTSGAISLNDMHIEVGGTSGTTCSLNDPDIRALISVDANGNQSIQQYYGKSSETQLPTSGSTVNGQVQLKQITASSYISSGGTLRIPSNMWVWSDDRTVAALTIDISCTVINDGKVIGKGGQGGSGLQLKNDAHPTTSNYRSGYHTSTLGTGGDGGPAIKINSGVSNVTITNSSGAYLCGGGGGGGSSGVEPQNSFSGGGGGAGGAEGGCADLYSFGYGEYGRGGALNAKGYYLSGSTQITTYGGEAGGPGVPSAGEDSRSSSGGGAGRKVPGARVNGMNYGSTATTGYGGAGGEAGGNGTYGGNTGGSGGGGGWGSAGGNGYRGAFVSHQCKGGDAGKAVDDSGVSYTLSNSGTIYGGT